MVENLEWSKLKPIFAKHPVNKLPMGRFRLNSVQTANTLAKECLNHLDNIKENEEKKERESMNVLEIIAQKVFSSKGESTSVPINTILQKHKPPIEFDCEHLRSVFTEHEETATENEPVATTTTSRDISSRVQGFVSTLR